jgi:DNA polymerase I-like protein with 3'-5' exonuclease and polymerase domains
MIELNGVLPEGTFLVATMHDELVIETDADKGAEIEVLAKRIMEKWAGAIFQKVPMLVEVKTLESWG